MMSEFEELNTEPKPGPRKQKAAMPKKRMMTRGSEFLDLGFPRQTLLKAFCHGHAVAKAADLLGASVDLDVWLTRWLELNQDVSPLVSHDAVRRCIEAGMLDYQENNA